MKKVSFIKGQKYWRSKLLFFSDLEITQYFVWAVSSSGNIKCLESFTAEITVKIVPYEQV